MDHDSLILNVNVAAHYMSLCFMQRNSFEIISFMSAAYIMHEIFPTTAFNHLFIYIQQPRMKVKKNDAFIMRNQTTKIKEGLPAVLFG